MHTDICTCCGQIKQLLAYKCAGEQTVPLRQSLYTKMLTILCQWKLRHLNRKIINSRNMSTGTEYLTLSTVLVTGRRDTSLADTGNNH